MRKFVWLFAVLALLASACSSGSDDSSRPDPTVDSSEDGSPDDVIDDSTGAATDSGSTTEGDSVDSHTV